MLVYNPVTESFDSLTESQSLYEIEPELMYYWVRNGLVDIEGFKVWIQECQDAHALGLDI
jgi:hypothetical protein